MEITGIIIITVIPIIVFQERYPKILQEIIVVHRATGEKIINHRTVTIIQGIQTERITITALRKAIIIILRETIIIIQTATREAITETTTTLGITVVHITAAQIIAVHEIADQEITAVTAGLTIHQKEMINKKNNS